MGTARAVPATLRHQAGHRSQASGSSVLRGAQVGVPPNTPVSRGSRGTHGRPSSRELLHARGQAASPGAGPHSARVRGEAGLPAGWQPPPLPTPAHPEKLPELLGGQSLSVWRRLALSCQKSSFSLSLAVPSSSDFLARGPSWIKDSLGGGQQDSALVVRKLCKGGLQLENIPARMQVLATKP